MAFNHVLLNRYRSDGDSMGLHADAEPELGPDPVVASVSLGVARRLVVRPRRHRAGGSLPFDLGAGSLFIMGGTCQRHYVHGVPRQPYVEGERISLTFRLVRRAPSPPRPDGGVRTSIDPSADSLRGDEAPAEYELSARSLTG